VKSIDVHAEEAGKPAESWRRTFVRRWSLSSRRPCHDCGGEFHLDEGW